MMIVDEKYRVDIYLDTNILVDYIEGTYPLLNKEYNLSLKLVYFVLPDFDINKRYLRTSVYSNRT